MIVNAPKPPNWQVLRKQRLQQLKAAATAKKSHELIGPILARKKWEKGKLPANKNKPVDLADRLTDIASRRAINMACRQFDIPPSKRAKLQVLLSKKADIDGTRIFRGLNETEKTQFRKIYVRFYEILGENLDSFIKRYDEIEKILFKEIEYKS